MEGNRLYKCVKNYDGFRKDRFYFFEIGRDGFLLALDDNTDQHCFDPLLYGHVDFFQKIFTPSTEEETEAWMSVKEGKKEEPKGFPSRDHLTKREMFAAMAIQGMLANSYYADAYAQSASGDDDSYPDEVMVSRAVEISDALLKALNEE